MNKPTTQLMHIAHIFYAPLIVLAGIIVSLLLDAFHAPPVFGTILLLGVIVYGSYGLFFETYQALRERRFALDYIAITAILLGVVTGNYLVAAIIVLMLSGGTTLEKYGMEQAKSSLTALADRIPNSVLLADGEGVGEAIPIDLVKVGQHIYVRRGEVIPLDGVLVSKLGLADESTLTGEPYEMEKRHGDVVRSGTVNIGNAMIVEVTHERAHSTYAKIVAMVQAAQEEKSPFIRLADRYSVIFTIITYSIATGAYLLSGSWDRVLSVLVIATPCPLILATPIALMGGVSAAARRRIIMKRLVTIEALSRITDVIFDKTGTITLGKPTVERIEIKNATVTKKEIMSIAAGIERSSIHPLAKAVVLYVKEQGFKSVLATDIHEEIGQGISGKVDNKTYTLQKAGGEEGMAIDVMCGKSTLARIHFEDHIKKESKKTIEQLNKLGLAIHIYTGDKQHAADRIGTQLGIPLTIKAQCSPEDKQNGIIALQKEGRVTAMVGDGINDAPALAMADVGMVFSHEEQTAASEAADVVFLGGDFESVIDTVKISKRTIHIATQSIVAGIGISTVGMLIAAFGFIPAVVGAFVQEAIDIMVIFNALRASKSE